MQQSLQKLLKRIALFITPPDAGSLNLAPDPMELPPLLEQVRTHLPEFQLSDDEVLAIAQLHDHKGKSSRKESFEVPPHVLSSLSEKGVIDNPLPQGDGVTPNNTSSTSPKQSRITFSRYFHDRLITTTALHVVTPFDSLEHYYLEWFMYVKRLYQYRKNQLAEHPLSKLDSDTGIRYGHERTKLTATEREFRSSYKLLLARSSTGSIEYPIEVLARNLELNEHERCVLLFLLYSSLAHEDCSGEDLLTLISRDPFDQFRKKDLLSPASKLFLFDLILTNSSRFKRYSLRTELKVHPQIERWLLTGEGRTDLIPNLTSHDRPYASNKDFITDWMRYITGLIQVAMRKDDDDDSDFADMFDDEDGEDFASTSEFHPILERLREQIRQRSKVTKKVFPIQKLTDDLSLSETERDILLIGLQGFLKKKSYRVSHVTEMLGEDAFDSNPRRYFQRNSTLIRNGLVVDPSTRMPTGRLALTEYARNVLLGRKSGQTVDIGELLSESEILQEVVPTQTLDDIVLPASLMSVLRTAIERFHSNAETLLREWGIVPSASMNQSTRPTRSSLTMIFSGLTGTGKSYTAGAMAKSLGRTIVATDISKLLSAWIGESEKHVAELFDTYQRLVEQSELAPVLLLNECDQFLTRRSINTPRAADRMYNQMQDIFLERLERFEGILIATTNLVDSLDEAFSRRFQYKLQFPFPDIPARRAIWKRHLRPPIPLSDDVDLETLAEAFAFNGGQISVAVHNAAIRAAIRGDKVTNSDLQICCEQEQQGSFDSSSRSRKVVGFKC